MCAHKGGYDVPAGLDKCEVFLVVVLSNSVTVVIKVCYTVGSHKYFLSLNVTVAM